PGIDLGLRTDPPTGEPADAAPAVGPLVVGPGAPVVAGPTGPVPDDPPVGDPGAAPAAAPAIGDPAGSGATRADEVSAKHR
ncbi:MAG TPA: hypothetical protein VF755_19080, partial [Catenuloplanes sp.]